jgi:SAM-dependent methyltransferase
MSVSDSRPVNSDAMSLLVPSRAPSSEEELMDVEPGERSEIECCLGHLARVNRLLGGWRTTLDHLSPLVAAAGGRTISVLDVASGGGDMAGAMQRWGTAHDLSFSFTFLDRHPLALEYSRSSSGVEPWLVRGDALRLPFRDRSFDIVTASLFFHHLEPDQAEAVLLEMRRVARAGILVNDLVRNRLAWASIFVLSRFFTRNRLVQHDGPLSVRRAYRPADFRRLARTVGLKRWGVRRHFPYRMCLWGVL